MANSSPPWRKINRPAIMAGMLICAMAIGLIGQHYQSKSVNKKFVPYDVTITHPSYQWTNEQGVIRGNIKAKRADYNTKSSETWLHQPAIVSQDVNHNLWHVVSKHGHSFQLKHMIHLWDNVVILKGTEGSPNLTSIHTNSLTLLPDQEKAYTNDKVLFEHGDHKIESYGVTIDIKNGIIHLLSNARGVYEPK